MLPSRVDLLLAATLLVASSGCTFHAYSPPTAVVMLETAETLKPEEMAVSVEGGVGGFVFAKGAGYASARVRRGLIDDLEGSVTLTGGYVHGGTFDCDPATDCRAGRADGFGLGARVGVKWAPWRQYFALTGGLGAGGSLFGAHGGADVGVIGSYDNPYFIPFVTSTVGLSVPFWARELQFGTSTDRARPTMWWQNALGFRIPIDPSEGNVRGSILGGIGGIYMHDGHEGVFGAFFSAGGEVTF